MRSTPTVSVIIPSYQHAAYIEACISSVQAQTFTDWEIVLVDDGSKDNSIEIVKSIDDQRIRVFTNQTNLGTYGTQNRALSESRGKYIAVLNSDDLWLPDKLLYQVRRLDEEVTLDLVYCLGQMVDEVGCLLPSPSVHGDWPIDTVQELLPNLLVENRVLASSVMVRREVAQFDSTLRYSGDWILLLSIAKNGPVGCISTPLNVWRQHPANSFRRSKNQLAEEIRVRRAILARSSAWMRPGLQRNLVDGGLIQCAMSLAALEVLVGNMESARKWAVWALRRSPGVSPLRRFMATCLPRRSAKKKLWPHELGDFTQIPELPPLEWRQGVNK